MNRNPLKQLGMFGQSIWLDYIRRAPASESRRTRRLWGALSRPNIFIKVLATAEGLPVIHQTNRRDMDGNLEENPEFISAPR